MSHPPDRLVSVNRLSAASLTGHQAGPPHPSVVARQAVDGRRLLPMAINAKAHGVIDGPLGNRHLREIAMTGRALDLCSNMRRVIEPQVRFPKEPINALPGEVFSTLCMIAQRLDSRIAGVANVLMTTHTDIDAWNSRARPLAHPRMAGVARDADIIGMDLMREVDRLLCLRLDV